MLWMEAFLQKELEIMGKKTNDIWTGEYDKKWIRKISDEKLIIAIKNAVNNINREGQEDNKYLSIVKRNGRWVGSFLY